MNKVTGRIYCTILHCYQPNFKFIVINKSDSKEQQETIIRKFALWKIKLIQDLISLLTS